jgi:hypothetical protein
VQEILKYREEKSMNTQPHDLDQTQHNSSAKISAWTFLNQEMVKILSEKIRAKMSQLAEQQAKSEAAKSRINNLAPSANRRQSPQVKKAVKIVVAGISAIAFSAGAQTLTSRLGSLSIPAALGVGSIAGVLADTKATEVITRKRRQQSTKQVLIAIEEQQQANPPLNELGKLSYQTEIALVEQVEGSNLEKQPILDIVLAVGLSGAEYVVSLSIVTGLGLPGGILLNAIVASLPLAMLWTGASIQSQCFEMPEHDRELIDQYEENILELTAEQQQQLAQIDEEIDLAEREINYKIALEEHRQKFITESNPRLKNWQMAEAEFQIDWLNKEKQQFQQECYQIIEPRLFKLKAELNELPNKFQLPTGTYSPDQIKALKDKWLKEQAGKLKADCAQELKWFNYKCENKMKQYDEKIAAAQQQYNEAYQAWKEENSHSNDNLGDAA